jgi:hypothetical protein
MVLARITPYQGQKRSFELVATIERGALLRDLPMAGEALLGRK